jgi:hypothetical protein
MTIILLNGPPRSGKDTAANIIKKNVPNFTEYKMSSPLKRTVREMFNLTIEQHKALEDIKDEPSDILGGHSYRDIQISLSEDWMKPTFGSKIFGEIAVKVINQRAGNVVISDIGFEDEVYPLRRAFTKRLCLIRIHRPGSNFDNDSRDYLPNSCLDNALIHDLYNQFNDLELYEAQILRILTKWKILKDI